MTREQAIEELSILLNQWQDSTTGDALDMAITTLSAESCLDAISRQAVLDVIKSMPNDNPSYWNSIDVINRQYTIDEIEDLPSIHAEPRTGNWIECDDEVKVFCSECKEVSDYPTMYCPNCGAKMESGEQA